MPDSQKAERTGPLEETLFATPDEQGAFNVTGKKIDVSQDGSVTEKGWMQLNEILKIYRDKRFESFRYLFIDREGKIKVQVVTGAQLPDMTYAYNTKENLGKIIDYAAKTNSRVLFVHNHPNGDPSPSSADIETTKSIGEAMNYGGRNIYAGHMILDHGKFQATCPEINDGEWLLYDTKTKEPDPLVKKTNNPILKRGMLTRQMILEIGRDIDANDEWKRENWIPLVLTHGPQIAKVTYIPRAWMEWANSTEMKKRLHELGKMAGATHAIPIVTKENVTPKLGAAIKSQAANGCFLDVYYDGKNLDAMGLGMYKDKAFILEAERNSMKKKLSMDSTTPLGLKNDFGVGGIIRENEELDVKDKSIPSANEEKNKEEETIADTSDTTNIQTRKIATNYVMDKLSAAGIKIVTDKKIFEKILENENRLQKLQGNLEDQKSIEKTNSLEVANALLFESVDEKHSNIKNAKEKNTPTNTLSTTNMFSFEGLNYIPVRNFDVGENRDINSKHKFNGALVKEPTTTTKFLTSDFYTAAGKNGNADIFYCVQQGLLCFPSTNGIFILSNKFNKNKKGKNEFTHDYDTETELFRNQNENLLKELNDISFHEKNDKELMKNISEVLEYGEIFNRKNETLGDVRIRKGSGVKADGILHMAERRLSKRVFHEKKDLEQAFKETAAIIFCAINNVDKAPAVKETDGHYATYKNGIKTVLKQDAEKGTYLVTGFDLDSTSKEATETIEAVIANYGYTPEFLGIYAQVGAAYASLYKSISESNNLSNGKVQNLIQNNVTYGFAYNGKIYLDPDLMNSNTPVHEYTHLWDAYAQKTNPELWEKGKDIFSQTQIWKDVKNDKNYADIASDDNLVLSEVHARICGDMAQKILKRISEEDGKITRDKVIDWDNEVQEYIAKELNADFPVPEIGSETYEYDSAKQKYIQDFFSKPMQDFMSGVQIVRESDFERNEIKTNNTVVDYELDRIQEAGIRVNLENENIKETQAWLNEANIVLQMLDEKPILIQLSENEKSVPGTTKSNLRRTLEKDMQDTPSAISTHIQLNDSTIQIQNQAFFSERFRTLQNEIEQNDNMVAPREFLNTLKEQFCLNLTEGKTGYAFYQNKNNETFKIRISNHNAILKNRTGTKTDLISVVIQLCENKGRNNENAVLREYVYHPDELTKEKELSIVEGITSWINTGIYTGKYYDEEHISTAAELKSQLQKITIQKHTEPLKQKNNITNQKGSDNIADTNGNVNTQTQTTESAEKNNMIIPMSILAAVMKTGETESVNNPVLGDVEIRLGNRYESLAHIIYRRVNERILRTENPLSKENAFKETAIILMTTVNNLKSKNTYKDFNGNYVAEENGIKAIITRDTDGKFLLTGFDMRTKKEEATEFIKSVSEQYAFTPEFLGIYAQVGAVYTSLESSISQAKNMSIKNRKVVVYNFQEIFQDVVENSPEKDILTIEQELIKKMRKSEREQYKVILSKKGITEENKIDFLNKLLDGETCLMQKNSLSKIVLDSKESSQQFDIDKNAVKPLSGKVGTVLQKEKINKIMQEAVDIPHAINVHAMLKETDKKNQKQPNIVKAPKKDSVFGL